MTQVESYLIDETKELISEVDKSDEWREKIKELGLTGQEELLNPEKPNASPVPFNYMNAQMNMVYRALCPKQDKIEDYNKTPIPLQVLSLIALCKQEGYFDDIYIWSDTKTPDPIAVGCRQGGNNIINKYIIARWGDELRSYPELVTIAKERIRENFMTQLDTAKAQIAEALLNPDSHIEKALNGGWVWIGGVNIPN